MMVVLELQGFLIGLYNTIALIIDSEKGMPDEVTVKGICIISGLQFMLYFFLYLASIYVLVIRIKRLYPEFYAIERKTILPVKVSICLLLLVNSAYSFWASSDNFS